MSSWNKKDAKLYRKFEFEDFKHSLEFVNKVGNLAEEYQHHPDITFGWGYVEIYLFSHSDNAITDKDYELAAKIDLVT